MNLPATRYFLNMYSTVHSDFAFPEESNNLSTTMRLGLDHGTAEESV